MNNYIYNLGQLFNKISSESGDAPALRFLNGEIKTYSDLESFSNRIASYLVFRGIQRGDVIAIFNDKGLTGYSIILACLKIGAIYTNLDPNSPVERLKKMISVCKPCLFLTDNGSKYKIDECGFDNLSVIDYSSAEITVILDGQSDNLPVENGSVSGNTPAYIMFTSGSTGFPKGVLISHSNVLNFINWSKSVYDISPDDIFTNINPMHFDNSVFDFYSSLFTGASLVPVSDDLARNPRKLLDRLNSVNPTIWFTVPSMLVYMLKMRALKNDDLQALRIVSFGGEGFPKNQLRSLWEYWGSRVKFINVYGPTECTCICSSYTVVDDDMKKDELLPLGPIAPNFDFVILDSECNEVKNGETGELCIGGTNVGLGYFCNIEKTAEVFIQNPKIKSHKDIIYRSGDLVRYNNEENLLYFCGRKDNQIKRMGYRIELEEIETAVGSLSYVEENAAIFINNENETGKIIVCLCSNLKDEGKILNELKKLIPYYMMPDEFVFYEHLPKNQNGKVNRLKLKEEYSI